MCSRIKGEGKVKGLVYKYRPLSQKTGEKISDFDKVMDILENNRLYFPNRSQLNDPLEGIIQPIYYSTLGSSYYISNGILQPEFKHILDEYKILSLSRHPDNMQMWAHYANNYCGVCIGFDMSNVEEKLRKVKYTKKKLKPIFIDREDDQQSRETEIVYNNLLYKSYFWKYEKEIRIIKKTPNMYYNLPQNAIKCIIFGNVLEIDPTDIERIAGVCEEKNIKMYHVVMAVNRFDIIIESFNIDDYRNGEYNPYISKDLFIVDGKTYVINSYYTDDGLHVSEFPEDIFENNISGGEH